MPDPNGFVALRAYWMENSMKVVLIVDVARVLMAIAILVELLR